MASELTDSALCTKLRAKADLLEAAGLDVSIFREAADRILAASNEKFELATRVGNLRRDYNTIVSLLIGDDFDFFDFEGWLTSLNNRLIEEGRSYNHAETLLSTLKMTDKRIAELLGNIDLIAEQVKSLESSLERVKE